MQRISGDRRGSIDTGQLLEPGSEVSVERLASCQCAVQLRSGADSAEDKVAAVALAAGIAAGSAVVLFGTGVAAAEFELGD